MISRDRRSLSIVSWNVESHTRLLAHAQETLGRLGDPDVLCVQEVRVRRRDQSLVGQLESALPGYVAHHSLCDDPRNVTFRGGRMYGVVTYVRRSLRAVALPSPAWDREGRFVGVALPALRLAIVNVYAVNGTSKPYFDPDTGRPDGDRHAFKRVFQRRLVEHVRSLGDRGLAWILIGDWNVSRAVIDTTPRFRTEEPHATARRELNEWVMPALDAVDAFREKHPHDRKYTWFNRRARHLDAARVDYALITRALLDHVEEVDVLDDPAARFGSDHAPITLRLRL